MTALTTAGLTACPRFSTPRDERFPTLGPQVGEVARRLGRPLMVWQQAAADVAYEYDPLTGLFRYDEADITVPRQSGKTTITLAKKVHRLTALARLYGPQRSTYIAQTRLKARNKLERDFAELLRSSRSFREVPNAKARPQRTSEWRLSLNNGAEHIQFGAGSFLQIDAPSRTGGHGDTLDDGTIDEAFAHEDDTVEAGMRPSMATRKNAQLWVISTAGDARSKYLWRKVLAGRAASETGEHGRVCYIEYSADDEADPGSPETWWSCMPALGVTISEDFIRGEWERALRKGPGGINTFRRAYLNQWPEIPILDDADGRVIAGSVWRALATNPPSGPPAAFAVDMTPDREWTSIGVFCDGVVDIVEHRRGVEWLLDACQRLAAAHESVVFAVDPRSPAATETEALRSAGLSVMEPTTGDVVRACGSFYDACVQGSVGHCGNAALDAAVAGAVKRSIGDGWAWDRKKGVVISPLVAVTLARWAGGRADVAGSVW